jgi:hypothetical protein
MAQGFILAFDSENPPLFDGGDRPFSVSNVASVGKAVVGTLQHFSKTANRVIYVHDLVITQNQVLAIARKLAPERMWKPVVVKTEELEAQSRENYAKGNITLHSSLGFLIRAAFGEGYGGEFQHVGVGFQTEADLEKMVDAALHHALVPGSEL